ncbi:MAG TPA: DoxX family protein [Paludibacter sp.]|nr:DoxX family protein [Paludibacter sp.]
MKHNYSWYGGLDNDFFHNTGLFLLRMILGFFMLSHGWHKIENFQMLTAGFPDPLNIGSASSLVLSIFAEFVCSVLVILGLFTRIVAVPIMVGMVATIFIIQSNLPRELAFLYLLLYVVLTFMGAGKFSLDYIFDLFCDKYSRPVGGGLDAMEE